MITTDLDLGPQELMKLTRSLLSLPLLVCAGILSTLPALADTDPPDFEIQSCSRSEMLRSDLKYLVSTDSAALCIRAREAMDFPLTAADMRSLVNSSVVASVTMTKRGETLSTENAFMQIVDIVRIRGLTGDHDGFKRTVDLVGRIVYGSEGRVPPATLLNELRAAGPLAKTMSDHGISNLAAMVSVQKKKGLSTVKPDSDHDVSDTVGEWDISGKLWPGGHLVMCRMQRDADGDASNFSYAAAIASGGGKLLVKAYFFFPSDLPDGSSPQVLIKFDGKNQITLKGGVDDGNIHAELPDDRLKMKKVLDLFTHSKNLTADVMTKSKRVAEVEVDLEDALEAFARNGACLKEMVGRATDEMKNDQ